jgi:hypothetical protein
MLPEQLDDVAHYPYVTQELLDRGWSESDIRKVLGGNILLPRGRNASRTSAVTLMPRCTEAASVHPIAPTSVAECHHARRTHGRLAFWSMTYICTKWSSTSCVAGTAASVTETDRA